MRFLSLFLLLSLLSLVACEKDETSITTSETFSVLGDLAPATISAYGRLTDESGEPVEGATVTAGDKTTTTDVEGLWRLDDAKVFATFGYITFESTGHLRGSRTVYAREGSTYEVDATLLSRAQSFTIDAVAGGTVAIPGSEATVIFGPGAFAKTDGTPITAGDVTVVAHYLDPNDERTYDRMPGDLRGVFAGDTLNANPSPVQLTTFGMIAVDLRTNTGAAAQLAEGQRATLTMPLTGAAAAAAPNTIPLWFFDDEVGVWKEEGEATKQGNAYVGTVSHFTFWNCDVASLTATVCGNVSFEAQGAEAARTTPLKVRLTSTRYGSRTTYVDADGNFCGIVPQGETFILEVLGDCNEVVFTANVGPFDGDVTLDPIVVPTSSARVIRVSGTVLCNGVPNGEASVNVRQVGSAGGFIRAEADGSFVVEFVSCNDELIEVIALDYGSLSQSEVQQFEIGSDLSAVSLDACGVELGEFIEFTVDGEIKYFSEVPVLYPDSSRGTIESMERTQVDGPGLVLYLSERYFDQPAGTYTLDSTATLQYFEGFEGPEVYFIAGTSITFSKDPATGRIAGSIPSSEVQVSGSRTGGLVLRTISLRFAVKED